ncbi:DtxR family iron (metal) dependent repressor [Lacrimispora xylanisolvens]|uniref:DtxR family iron (Metal) dependent repressor n=1 Tax=Lacrimispora xylanisolvens TaxID=384636 RepID=A0A2S6HP42_9FIRM|nr:metal-dependent transcriptional regulator [Hungatella xylanolytica]MBE5988081.1 metal-dependent transcriptional regulator [Paenibacillaceae bacterium]MBE5991216.1 metal-dependent transcriptional regulator [Paenibacillaceae bacterium]MTK07476.1 metal-dependent transcriptional regulator [Hungatella sp.]PPK79303.1 DtxR family iron (metal) dependent repressor [Hungatella xylanolytica]
MPQNDNFYTLKGYSLLEHTKITSSMEDYLEMIYRLSQENQPVRIKELAECLHVKPSSASKMTGNLRKQGLVGFEKYGTVSLTSDGKELGEYLLFRHQILTRFFCYVNQKTDDLEQVEKVEHFIDPETVYNIQKWLDKFA